MRISEDFIKEKVDEECILLPIGEDYPNGIFKLNEGAEKIYELLCDGKSRDEIVAVLSEEYEDESGTLSQYVDDFIRELMKAGILLDD